MLKLQHDVLKRAHQKAFASAVQAKKDTLAKREKLKQDQSLWSRNGKYRLTMRGDCNLVGYEGDEVFWSSRTAGKGQDCEAEMQDNGNFVIYARGRKPIWHTATNGKGKRLVMQDDRNVCVYDGWCSYSHVGAKQHTLAKGEKLKPLRSLWSKSGKYQLTMQADCNLVGYEGVLDDKVFWSSRTTGKGQDCEAEMQDDGNFVIYAKGRKPIWHTATNGKGKRLVMQDDRNVCVYDGWCSFSHVGAKQHALAKGEKLKPLRSLWSKSGKYQLTMQADCNLVGYEGVLDDKVFWSSRTTGKGQDCEAEMQDDGNFVIYAKGRKPIWDTATVGKGKRLVMQDDRNVCVYDGWCSYSHV